MKLSELLEKGIVAEDDYEVKTLEWGDGEEKDIFEVYVKKEPSVADIDFIYDQSDDGRGKFEQMARAVHRLIRFDGHESIPLDKAYQLKYTFLLLLFTAIPLAKKVHGEEGND